MNTVLSQYKVLRQSMADDYMDNGASRYIGGYIIEIDESNFGKMNDHSVIRVTSNWVFCGYCINTGE